jgi:phosphopantetheine--protein transferase-like protein
MAGKTVESAIGDYLAGLLGETVSPDMPLRLRSVQTYALRAWARREEIALNQSILVSGNAFTVKQLVSDHESVVKPAGAPVTGRASEKNNALRVGIDIEDVSALPPADDYREHPFYRDNFTPSEISHCLQQRDVRASLAGIWAAKEAIVKADVASSNEAGLKSIEIKHDAIGKPFAQGCNLSISHTPTSAVCVCIALDTPDLPAPIGPIPPILREALPLMEQSRWRLNFGAIGALLLLSIGGIFFALHLHNL